MIGQTSLLEMQVASYITQMYWIAENVVGVRIRSLNVKQTFQKDNGSIWIVHLTTFCKKNKNKQSILQVHAKKKQGEMNCLFKTMSLGYMSLVMDIYTCSLQIAYMGDVVCWLFTDGEARHCLFITFILIWIVPTDLCVHYYRHCIYATWIPSSMWMHLNGSLLCIILKICITTGLGKSEIMSWTVIYELSDGVIKTKFSDYSCWKWSYSYVLHLICSRICELTYATACVSDTNSIVQL